MFTLGPGFLLRAGVSLLDGCSLSFGESPVSSALDVRSLEILLAAGVRVGVAGTSCEL